MKQPISVFTRRDIIRNVRHRWNEQYKHYGPEEMIGRPQEPIKNINARLRKLDLESCSVADVDKAIGTTGWAANECDVCGTDTETAVTLHSRFSDDRWMTICPACIKHAAKLLRSPQGSEQS